MIIDLKKNKTMSLFFYPNHPFDNGEFDFGQIPIFNTWYKCAFGIFLPVAQM